MGPLLVLPFIATAVGIGAGVATVASGLAGTAYSIFKIVKETKNGNNKSREITAVAEKPYHDPQKQPIGSPPKFQGRPDNKTYAMEPTKKPFVPTGRTNWTAEIHYVKK